MKMMKCSANGALALLTFAASMSALADASEQTLPRSLCGVYVGTSVEAFPELRFVRSTEAGTRAFKDEDGKMVDRPISTMVARLPNCGEIAVSRDKPLEPPPVEIVMRSEHPRPILSIAYRPRETCDELQRTYEKKFGSATSTSNFGQEVLWRNAAGHELVLNTHAKGCTITLR